MIASISPNQPRSIQGMFRDIAENYDTANTVLSLGTDRSWRKKLVRMSGVRRGDRILDCATGTGDLAFEFEAALEGQCEVIGCDFCEEMLEVARRKASFRGSNVQFQFADATTLPYAENTFNIASVAFGIRNTEDPVLALAELSRVVVPGGRVLVLEMGQPWFPVFKFIFDAYSKWVLPRLGGLITGSSRAYRYLQTSSAGFPCGQRFLDLARQSRGYSEMSFRSIQGGIAYLYDLKVANRGHS